MAAATLNIFLPSSTEDLTNTYIQVGNEANVDWSEILIYDTVRLNNDLEKVKPQESVFDFFIINMIRYEEERVEHSWSYEVEGETVTEHWTEIIWVEVERRRATGYKNIRSLLGSIGYNTRESNMKLKPIKNYTEQLSSSEEYSITIERRSIEDLIQSFDQEHQNWAYDLLTSIHFIYSDVAREEYYLPDGVYPFMFPTPGIRRITSPFGYRTHPVTGERFSFHAGIDIAEPGCHGKPVVAVADGKVIEVNYSGGTLGYNIRIDHEVEGALWQSRYAHLSAMDVRVGDKVVQGQTIGAIGNTGRSTGPHLHFELKYKGGLVDPLLYLTR